MPLYTEPLQTPENRGQGGQGVGLTQAFAEWLVDTIPEGGGV